MKSFFDPALLLIGILVVLLLLRNNRKKKILLIVITGLTVLFTNPALLNLALIGYEYSPYKAAPGDHPPFDLGIVLGGFSQSSVENRAYRAPVVFGEEGCRLTTALQLYHKNYFTKFLLSGGHTATNYEADTNSEAGLMYRFLLNEQIAPQNMLVENQSLNTIENGKFSAKLITSGEKTLLITSAIHMNRSLKIFRHFGIDPVPYPTCYKQQSWSKGFWYYMRPDVKCLLTWKYLWIEWAALAYFNLSV